MPLENQAIETLSKAHLSQLVADRVSEALTLDYKLTLPGTSDEDKREFLADVSSFANSSGGYLFFGIREAEGIATTVEGVEVADADAEVLRLDAIIRDGLAPRIPGVRIRPIPLGTGRVVMAIKVPRSWASPHMIVFRNNSRFFVRGPAGKRQLDVQELRAAFERAELLENRIREFRLGRIAKIQAGELPVVLEGQARVVLHLLPFESFDIGRRLDISSLGEGPLRPMGARGWSPFYNFDGLVIQARNQGDPCSSYIQVFRNGVIEAAESHSLVEEPDGRHSIPTGLIEEELIDGVNEFVRAQRDLGVNPPLAITVSLLGVKGYVLAVNRAAAYGHREIAIDRDVLLIPDVVVESLEFDATTILRPVFDAIWNAGGWAHSLNYDAQGARIPRR